VQSRDIATSCRPITLVEILTTRGCTRALKVLSLSLSRLGRAEENSFQARGLGCDAIATRRRYVHVFSTQATRLSLSLSLSLKGVFLIKRLALDITSRLIAAGVAAPPRSVVNGTDSRMCPVSLVRVHIYVCVYGSFSFFPRERIPNLPRREQHLSR